MIKHTRNLCLGSNDNTVNSGTGRSVGGEVAEGVIILTLTLGKELGGSATVTIYCPYTTESEHSLANLVGAKTYCVGSVTSLSLTDNESTISLYTNHGSVRSITTANSLGYKLAVFDYKSKVCGNCLPLIALKSISSRTELKFYSAVSVLYNCKEGRCTGMNRPVCEYLAVVNHNTVRSLIVI